MLNLVFAFLLVFLPVQSLSDWRPVPAHNLVFDTGFCGTDAVGDPIRMYSSSEQCYDLVQQISKATVQRDNRRYAARGQSTMNLTITGQFEFVKVWRGSTLIDTYIGWSGVTIPVPANDIITLQVIHSSGAPAEIYAINES